MSDSEAIRRGLRESASLLLAVMEEQADLVARMGRLLAATVGRGGTIYFCGNGGSAAEAQHLATELVGRFIRERPALPAVALAADSSLLTSVGNDYGFDRIFARQIEALGRRGDVLVALTTSGRSANVLAAVRVARARRLRVLGLTGARGGSFARRCDLCLIVPSRETPRIQEVHLAVGHLWCEEIERSVGRVPRGARARPRRAGKTRRGGRA